MSTIRTSTALARHETARSANAMRLSHAVILFVQALLLVAFVILALIVHAHPGPLSGDVRIATDLQHSIRPHRTLADAMDLASTIAWPIPSAITVGIFTVVFLLLRRWLDAIVVLLLPGLANGVNYLLSEAIHRPRPSDHGLYIAQHISISYSFPSGHVLQGVTFFGFVLFLTFMLFKPARWLWFVRAALVVLILDMSPSRILEGEHWPSDALGAWLCGIFWVLLAIQFYAWAGRRWPRLRGTAPAVEAAEPHLKRP
jgi:membrane-associated phospholipid phosphatase